MDVRWLTFLRIISTGPVPVIIRLNSNFLPEISVRLSFNTAPYFQLKKTFLFISLFFNTTRKFCTFFMKSLFPHDKFIHGKILPRNPLTPEQVWLEFRSHRISFFFSSPFSIQPLNFKFEHFCFASSFLFCPPSISLHLARLSILIRDGR